MDKATNPALDLIWGVESIAQIIGRTPRQTHYLLTTGSLPAKQMGTRWVIKRDTLERFFSDLESVA